MGNHKRGCQEWYALEADRPARAARQTRKAGKATLEFEQLPSCLDLQLAGFHGELPNIHGQETEFQVWVLNPIWLVKMWPLGALEAQSLEREGERRRVETEERVAS